MGDDLDTSEVYRIVAAVRASAKYGTVCRSTVERIAAQEWGKGRSLKQAIKATKNRLHQAYSAYESRIDYDRVYGSLEAAYAADTPEGIRAACRRILNLHASSRERLPILDRFYAGIFAHTGTPRSLLDLACGLNPLSLPWMGLSYPSSGDPLAGKRVVYYAYDIDTARVAFLNRYLCLAGVQACACAQDVICDLPAEGADVALLLKSSACLERQKKGATLALLDALDVSYAVVTFPVKSLGRREKGMPAHYAQTFAEMLSVRPWPVTRLDFATEQAFIVDKRQVRS